MARKKKHKGLKRLTVVAIVGGGAWWLWKSGKWQQFYSAVMPGTTPPPSDPTTDPTDAIDTTGAGELAAGTLAAILAWMQGNDDETPDPNPDPGTDTDPGTTPSIDEVESSTSWLNTGLFGAGTMTPLHGLAAVGFSLAALEQVNQQGEHWGELYTTLTPEQQTTASSIMATDVGSGAIPASIQQARDLAAFAVSVDNADARALLTPAESRLLDQYASVLGVR